MKQIITKSYKWEYTTCGKNDEIGIISREDHQSRCLAIAAGEYKPKGYEPRTWHFSWDHGEKGAVRDERFNKRE